MTETDFQMVAVGFVIDLVFSWVSNVAFSFYHTFSR